jgi:ATP-dependent DNA ligase
MINYFNKQEIEKYYPSAYMIPPMLAWKLPKGKENMREKVFNNGDYFAELKIDGSCYTLEHTLDGNIYMFSRTVSAKNRLLVEKSDRVPHLVEFFKTILPKGTVVALELYIEGGKSKDVTSITGCLPAKAIKRQEEQGFLKACIHDLLIYKNEIFMNRPAIDRIHFLYQLLMNDLTQNIILPSVITEGINEFLERAWQQGSEGIILKKKLGAYYPSKRPAWEWIKFKIEDSYDVIAISFNPPTKEYTGKEIEKWSYWEGAIPVTKPYANGWIGSINMGVYKDNEIIPIGSVASGITDAILEKIKSNPEKYIGKPMEVKAMEGTTDGKLREPKFIEFREDINLQDCNWNKIFT